MKAIEKIKQAYDLDDVYLGGDFNLIPNSMLYTYMIHHKIDFDAALIEYSNQTMMNKLF